MSSRFILSMTGTIAPGATARVSARPRVAFRPERLLVSPHSFPLSLARRAWTWPLVALGNVLGRVHRGLARLLRVDLHATHERREYVSAEYARTHADEASWEYASWDQDDENEDEDDGRPFILVSTPLDRREYLLDPLGRAARRLSGLRLSWQRAQLATVLVRNITISNQPQPFDGGPTWAVDPLATPLTAAPLIEIDVHNGNRRECQLVMTFIGSTGPS